MANTKQKVYCVKNFFNEFYNIYLVHKKQKLSSCLIKAPTNR